MNDDHLSRLIDDAVADIEPSDRLAEIRLRTRRSSPRRRLLAGTSLLAAAAVVTAFAVSSTLGSDQDGPGPSTRVTDTTAPSTEPSIEPSTDVPLQAVPAYYVGDTGRGPRLFREFVDVAAALPAITGALEALEATPGDPDYRTLWTDDPFVGGTVVRDVIEVELRDGAIRSRPSGFTAAEAALAVEQVVYSVQGAAGARLPVQFRVNGTPIDQVYGVPTSEPITEGLATEVLSLMSITTPYEGMEVSGSFVAEGVNNGYEATMEWRIEAQSGDAVLNGFATADGWMGERLWSWTTDSIDVSTLPPGTYTFIAVNPDPSGGEGFAPDADTRSITVK